MQLPSDLAEPAAPYQNVDVPNALRVMRPTPGDNTELALYGDEACSFDIERK